MLEGDSSFGIDRTSSEFKETKAMKQIFGEQRSRREKGHAKASDGVTEAKEQKMLSKEAVDNTNVNSLVSKLKRKYAEQSKNEVKKARL